MGRAAYIGELRQALPPEVLQTMERYEAAGEFDAPEYTSLVYTHVYKRHICRVEP